MVGAQAPSSKVGKATSPRKRNSDRKVGSVYEGVLSSARSAKKPAAVSSADRDGLAAPSEPRLTGGKPSVNMISKHAAPGGKTLTSMITHSQRIASSKAVPTRFITAQSKQANQLASKGHRYIRIQSGTHNMLKNGQANAGPRENNRTEKTFGLASGSSRMVGSRKSAQVYQTERKVPNPAEPSSLNGNMHGQETPAGRRGLNCHSFQSDHGLNLRKNPSISSPLAAHNYHTEEDMDGDSHDLQNHSNSLIHIPRNLQKTSARPSGLSKPGSFFNGPALQRVPSKLAGSLADLTVEEEPDAEAFISPD